MALELATGSGRPIRRIRWIHLFDPLLSHPILYYTTIALGKDNFEQPENASGEMVSLVNNYSSVPTYLLEFAIPLFGLLSSASSPCLFSFDFWFRAVFCIHSPTNKFSLTPSHRVMSFRRSTCEPTIYDDICLKSWQSGWLRSVHGWHSILEFSHSGSTQWISSVGSVR